ncbi:dihydroorotate dehydrogenase electron transfer subunit [Ectothiorhodospiraceae bacterium 2226]|nr:dihydroorotate dehydrogenase electron transfer subunit [Ectothiorhodospiraceae bacterium 2226]
MPSAASSKPHRDTLLVEDAEVLSQQGYPGDQYVLRVQAPRIAARAQPGSFAHITCDPLLPMRRPLSIMRVSPEAGWVDFLYKALGTGTNLLARRVPGERISLIGPIGVPFQPEPGRPRALLLGGGVGIPPMIFLAEHLRALGGHRPLVLMGSEVPFPFTARPSQIMLPGMPEGVIAAMPLMEDWKIPSRLATKQGYPGCFDGYVPELARQWLNALDAPARAEVAIYACGPHPMLEATARLGAEFDVPCQVSLEEFMACAVGGCAGCVVEVQTATGAAMKRVCVDGPVFAARSVFPHAYA